MHSINIATQVRRRRGVIPPTYSSYSCLMAEWSANAPAALYPRERTPGTHCTGGWVGLRAGLDTEVKRINPLHLPGIEPWSSSL
jgi:hypothetical protein